MLTGITCDRSLSGIGSPRVICKYVAEIYNYDLLDDEKDDVTMATAEMQCLEMRINGLSPA